MKTLNHLLVCAALLAPLSFTAGASAQPAVGPAPVAEASPDATATAVDLTDGEVRKVDREAATITLKHGDIRNLDMPGMTMVFKISDPALLDKVKAGDRVRFTAEKVNGAIAVTRIEKGQ
jgi:Cu(I)/Ag(I) efflux system protein CusF